MPARWLVLPDGRAVVEAAAAIGLPLLAREERDPLVASSRGLGELIAAALREEPPALLVGLGGSATVDGGVGSPRGGVRARRADDGALRRAHARSPTRRACSGRRRARRPRPCPCSSDDSPRWRSSRRTQVSPAPGLPAGSARLSRRWARSSSRARRRFSTSSDSTRGSRMRPRRHRRGPGRPNHRRGQGARRRRARAALRPAFAASCSAGASSSPSTGARRSACQAIVRARRPTSKSSADVSPASGAIQPARAGRPSTRASSRRRPAATRRTA